MQADLLAAALAVACVSVAAGSLPGQEHKSPALAHTRTEFHFTVNATIEQTGPLFGADEERKWAPGWEPQFLYPIPAKDQPGSVFLVQHGHNNSVWTTTAFDLPAGHIQYVYVIHDVMVTLIDIRLSREDAKKTGVSVTYERTALTREANEHVTRAAKEDEGFGQEWQEQINGYLDTSRTR
jgi:hypothetical protein